MKVCASFTFPEEELAIPCNSPEPEAELTEADEPKMEFFTET
jgi:hypothetical protein